MKWYIALNDHCGLEDRKSTVEMYQQYALVAVRSAKINAPLLEPHLIYNGSPCSFTSEMKSLGVSVHFHRLSFQEEIDLEQSRSEIWKQVAKGAMLRLDLPEVDLTDDTVLYTDTDVIFLKDPSIFNWSEVKTFAVSSEFAINDFTKPNTGVMVLNLAGVRESFKALRAWTVQNLAIVPDYDQGAIRMFYATQWELLDQRMNWKPYWGINDQAIVIHYHGPKPFDTLAESGEVKADQGIYRQLYNQSPDGYKYYMDSWNKVLLSYLYHKYI